MKRDRYRGFTLVELLVVIAIIAIRVASMRCTATVASPSSTTGLISPYGRLSPRSPARRCSRISRGIPYSFLVSVSDGKTIRRDANRMW